MIHKQEFNLTDKEWAAARLVASGKSYHMACKLAGYSDPNGESARLRDKPEFLRAVIGLDRTAVVGWANLVEMSIKTIEKCHKEYQSLSQEEKDTIKELQAARKDAMIAARTVFDTVRQSGAVPLKAQAEAEDQNTTVEQVANRILGSTPVLIIPPPSEDEASH